MADTNQPRVPTLRAVDHCAYTVPDLDEAVRFFVDHFGAELVFFDGPFIDKESDGMRRRLNVDPRAQCTIAMIRIGAHHNVELFQYEAPDQNTTLPRNSDIGGHHLAFYVDDIDAAYEYVRVDPWRGSARGTQRGGSRSAGCRPAMVLLPVAVGHAAGTDNLRLWRILRGTSRIGHGPAEQDVALNPMRVARSGVRDRSGKQPTGLGGGRRRRSRDPLCDDSAAVSVPRAIFMVGL